MGAKLELKKSKRKDYYKILGVDKNANEEEIKKAYRKRAMVHHPDRHSGATEAEKRDHEQKFKEVGEAYAILSDEKKRRMYDSGQDLDGGEGHGFHDVDPNSIFQAFFGGGGMGGHPGMGVIMEGTTSISEEVMVVVLRAFHSSLARMLPSDVCA